MKTLFPKEEKLTPKIVEELSPMIRSWTTLNEVLREDTVPVSTLRHLLTIEARGRKRPGILEPLIGRICSRERKRLWKLCNG
jgi:hypothetical protein